MDFWRMLKYMGSICFLAPLLKQYWNHIIQYFLKGLVGGMGGYWRALKVISRWVLSFFLPDLPVYVYKNIQLEILNYI